MLWNKSTVTDGGLVGIHLMKMQEIDPSWSQPILYGWQKKPRKWLEIKRQQETATMSCLWLFWKGKQRTQKLVNSIEGFVNPFSYQYNDIINLVTKSCNARENQTGYMPYWRSWGCKAGNLHSRTFKNGTGKYLDNNTIGSASNLVFLL